MLVTFVAATLEVIAGSGKVPTITLRSIDPIKVDGTVADTVNDGRYSVRLSPGQTEWLSARLSSPDEAFVSAVNSGSVTLPDASRGKRAAKGVGILSILPAMAADEGGNGDENADADAPTGDAGSAPDAEPTPEPTAKAKARQRRS